MESRERERERGGEKQARPLGDVTLFLFTCLSCRSVRASHPALHTQHEAAKTANTPLQPFPLQPLPVLQVGLIEEFEVGVCLWLVIWCGSANAFRVDNEGNVGEKGRDGEVEERSILARKKQVTVCRFADNERLPVML